MFDKNHIKILFICTCIIFVTILYQLFLCNSDLGYDPLEKIHLGVGDIDGWSLTHFIFFFFLGYFFPKYYLFILTLGIIWEIIEYITGIINQKNKVTLICDLTRIKRDSWWYSKVSDIFVNIAGFIVGASLSIYLKK